MRRFHVERFPNFVSLMTLNGGHSHSHGPSHSNAILRLIVMANVLFSFKNVLNWMNVSSVH